MGQALLCLTGWLLQDSGEGSALPQWQSRVGHEQRGFYLYGGDSVQDSLYLVVDSSVVS